MNKPLIIHCLLISISIFDEKKQLFNTSLKYSFIIVLSVRIIVIFVPFYLLIN